MFMAIPLGILAALFMIELGHTSDKQMHELVCDIIAPAIGWVVFGFVAITVFGVLIITSLSPFILTIIYFFTR